jgi:hypothetical protein
MNQLPPPSYPSLITAGLTVVSQLRWWNPLLLFAQITVCLGGGLLTTIRPNTSGSHWVGYQTLGGIGYSLASNLVRVDTQVGNGTNYCPLTALTVSSPHADFCSPRPHTIWCFDSSHRHIDKLRTVPCPLASRIPKASRDEPKRCH